MTPENTRDETSAPPAERAAEQASQDPDPGQPARPHVVILGGGFAGLYAARQLRGESVRVSLVDRHNYHLFQPLLYQVATGALTSSSVASPLRTIFRKQRNVETIMATACSVDTDAKVVVLDEGMLSYDYLVIATGSTFSYFGHDEWAERAPGLKCLEDAMEIRRRIFRAFEAAEREQDPIACERWLTFVVVGAGPTGVELAGTMAEISQRTLAHDFHHIEPSRTRIVLLDAAPRVLPMYPEDLSERARQKLCELGVEVLTGEMVTDVSEQGVRCKSGLEVRAHTMLWAAGVQATPLAKSLGVPLDRQGRVLVNRDLTVPGHPDIFVIGDLINLEQDGEPIPGLAPAAIQEGKHTAANIGRAVRGKPLEPFRYRHRGSFAVIGRGAAVGEMYGRYHVSGLPAWLAWLLIHVYFIIGFHKRLLVMMQWAYSYLTHRRGARIVTGKGVFGLQQPRYTAADMVAQAEKAAAAQRVAGNAASADEAARTAEARTKKKKSREEEAA